MNHAVPVTICLDCDKPYDVLMRTYTNLQEGIDEKNVSCKSQFFNLDRLGVVQRSYQSAISLWTGGYCDNCYESPLVVSNDTLEFLDWIGAFNECTVKNALNVCVKCADVYDRANKKYEDIYGHVQDRACFDLQDKINATRRYWSTDVQCNLNPDEKQITFLILTAAVTSLPICFYVLMFAHKHHRDRYEEDEAILNESIAEPGDDLEQ